MALLFFYICTTVYVILLPCALSPVRCAVQNTVITSLKMQIKRPFKLDEFFINISNNFVRARRVLSINGRDQNKHGAQQIYFLNLAQTSYQINNTTNNYFFSN